MVNLTEEQSKQAIEKMCEYNMHVKAIGSDSIGVLLTAIDTHYVMQDERIVHVGNEQTCMIFALSPRSSKAMESLKF